MNGFFTMARTTLKKISLVVFDLAGTVVDFGSRAPAGAFCELFRRHGIIATESEARIPMGLHKRDHIAEMLAMPSIASQWRLRNSREHCAKDVEALFNEFLPLQLEALPKFADAIPGAAKAIESLRRNDVKIAATTGYNREMTDVVLVALANQGVTFDYTCCAAEVPAGRPRPWMIFRCMEALDVYPPNRVLNIGDTVADIKAGTNAGCWSVGVTMTGNLLGMSRERVEALGTKETEALRKKAEVEMFAAGADMVLESVKETSRAVEALEHDLMKSKTPGTRIVQMKEPALNRILEKSSLPAGVSLR